MKEAKLKVISFSNSDVIATSGLQWGHVSLKGSPRYSGLDGDATEGYWLDGYGNETSGGELGSDWEDVTRQTYIYDAGGKLIASGPLMDVSGNVPGNDEGVFHFAYGGDANYFQLCDTNCKHTN